MKNNKVIIFGTGQIAEEVNNYFEKDSEYRVVGFTVDDNYSKKKYFMGKPVIPFSQIKSKFSPKHYRIFIAIGYTDLNQLRYSKYVEAKKNRSTFDRHASAA